MTEAVTVRDYKPEDRPYILDSGWRSILHNSAYTDGCTPGQIIDALDMLLSRWNCKVLCVASDPSTIMGWLIYSVSNTVAWIYVRDGGQPSFRGRGWARKMLEAALIKTGQVACVFCASDRDWIGKMNKHGWSFRLRPYLALP